MLKININKIFRLRGISKPQLFLRNNGFTDSKAFNITRYKTPALKLDNLERLCALLSCTPNDLLEWHPDKNFTLPETHPLHKLKPTESINIAEMLKDVPAEKIAEFKSGIEELKTKLKQ
jgi:DNA-binding Xre family transcriptional regulator